jgi:hypothetical protein
MKGKNENSVSQVRQFISKVVGVRGHMPPDWTTVSRWMEKLENAGGLTKEGILQMLELHYNDDFGAKEKLMSMPDVEKKMNITPYMARKIAKDAGILIQLGGRYCIRKKDFERVYKSK